MKSHTFILRAAALFVVATMFTACGPGEKSRELKDLETILQDPDAKNVRSAPGASKPYRESRQFRNLALESWEEGKDDLSVEYAILGTLRYRTAAAIMDQVDAKNRLDTANEKIETDNPEIMTLTQERNKLTNEVANLERQVARARGNGATQGGDGEARKQITDRLKDVDAAKKQADLVDARIHAPKEYNQAANLVNSVQLMVNNNQTDAKVLASATEAQRLYLVARNKSEPVFQSAAARANPEERRAKLRADASKIYGASAVLSERLGGRIVLAGLFDQGQSSIKSDMKVMTDELVKLAKTYDEFEIYIEGYTSKTGSATENLGLSQLRANAVRDALLSGGVKSSRLETRGYGQDRLRFPGVDERNERVEVVMSRSN